MFGSFDVPVNAVDVCVKVGLPLSTSKECLYVICVMVAIFIGRGPGFVSVR